MKNVRHFSDNSHFSSGERPHSNFRLVLITINEKFNYQGSSGKQDSISSKHSTLKRPHDQMTPTMQNGCRIDQDGKFCADVSPV